LARSSTAIWGKVGEGKEGGGDDWGDGEQNERRKGRGKGRGKGKEEKREEEEEWEWEGERVGPQGADSSPPPLRVAKTGKNHLNEEITPPPP
jgi:hypothetical protein